MTNYCDWGTRLRGSVIFYHPTKGYGLIEVDDAYGLRLSTSVFFHFSFLRNPQSKIDAGMRVEFSAQPNTSRKHPVKAVDVEIIGGAL
jgi:cold shock CspA family protein